MTPRGALASRLVPFGTTIFSEMTRLALEHGAINLAQGFPDFDGPDFARDAALEAVRNGRNGQYARMLGLPALNAALSRKYQRDWGLSYDPDREITVTSGATEAILSTILGICEPGDEVVLFEPFYDSYRACVALAGATARVVTLRSPYGGPGGGFSFDAAELASAFGPRTRLVVVNTPHNPTGRLFTRDELALVGALAERHGAYVLSDEVYEHLVYEGAHVPTASLPGLRERTVTISSFGKTFSFTGWKVGWACAPPELSAAVRAAHQFATFATATPLQAAAAAALDAAPGYLPQLSADYRERRDYLAGVLLEVGFEVLPPAGTYFVCAGIGRLGFTDDVAFCRHLVEKVGVAAIPPSVFYERPELGKGYVRFAFCKRPETLEAAASRLRRLGSA